MSVSSHQSKAQPDEDAGLILAAQKDPASFEHLYNRWVIPIYQYFYHRTREVSAAEDLTSQLFLAVYQALPRYQHRGRFAAWLFTIARNLYRTFYRKDQREAPLEAGLHLRRPVDFAGQDHEADEIERLIRLVRSLPEEEQELIRLRYVADLSFADIALILNKREDAVKKTLYRLQARLQRLMEEMHD
ncbi:MAG: RNA polymerase sigma factor [Anaerolineales bacterium]|nr:RNA polymerase sigma factor [Anaerolineales bacterium]